MTYCRKPEIVARSVAGEHVLIPIQGCTNRVYTLNGVGRWLWELLATPCSDGDLLEALVERYGISPETACVDVSHFLDEMKRMGLLEVVEGWKDEALAKPLRGVCKREVRSQNTGVRI